jgi:hypothetical protein
MRQLVGANSRKEPGAEIETGDEAGGYAVLRQRARVVTGFGGPIMAHAAAGEGAGK